jgi:hypothetical protein
MHPAVVNRWHRPHSATRELVVSVDDTSPQGQPEWSWAPSRGFIERLQARCDGPEPRLQTGRQRAHYTNCVALEKALLRALSGGSMRLTDTSLVPELNEYRYLLETATADGSPNGGYLRKSDGTLTDPLKAQFVAVTGSFWRNRLCAHVRYARMGRTRARPSYDVR